MSERRVGWYWVMLRGSGDWECGKWDGKGWSLTNSTDSWDDCDLFRIGHDIHSPSGTDD